MITAYLINGNPVGTVLQTWLDSDLNGNPAFKYETSVSSGYADISSITSWDAFGYNTGKDFKFIRLQINNLRVSTGYANLPLNEKILANKYFASGVEYFNQQVTTSEQNAFFLSFLKPGSDSSRKERDIAISGYIIQKIYTGVYTQTIVDQLIKDSEELRTKYLRDGLQGIGYGDTIVGVINFVNNTSEYSPFTIVGVDTNTKTFSVLGNKTSEFTVDKVIRIHSSTNNNGGYTVVSSSFDNTNTNIIVNETIQSNTADGSIYTRGLLWYQSITITQQNELFDIYWNGAY